MDMRSPRPHILQLFGLVLALGFAACNEPVVTRGATGRKQTAKTETIGATAIKGTLALESDPTNAAALSFAGATIVVSGKPSLQATADAAGAFTLTIEAAPPPSATPVKAAVGGFGLADTASTDAAKAAAAAAAQTTNYTLYAFATLNGAPYAGLSADVPVKKGESTTIGALQLKPTGFVKGRVLLDGQVDFAGTAVSLPLAALSAKTDNLGNFVIAGVPDGAWQVRYEHPGYLTQDSASIAVTTGKATELAVVTLFSATGTSAVVVVNGGLELSPTRAVAVHVEPSPTATLMMTAEDEAFTGAEWRPLQKDFVHTLAGDGKRTLYVKVADDAGTASPVYQAAVWVSDRDKDVKLDAEDCAPDDPTLTQKSPYSLRDADADGKFIAQAGEVCAGTALPTGYLAAPTSDERDCNDDDATVWVIGAAATDFDGDGRGGAQVYVCMGATPPAGHVAAVDDCDDTNPEAWKLVQAFEDVDQDTKGEGESAALCAADELSAGKVLVGGDEFPKDQARSAYLGTLSWGGNSSDQSHAMARLPTGDLLLLGSYAATDASGVDLDWTTGTNVKTKLVGGRNVYVSRMGDDGTYAWSAQWDGGATELEGFGVASDSAGGVYAVGTYEGTLDFDPGAGTSNETSNLVGTTGDAFVVKLTGGGAFDSVITFGGEPEGALTKRFQPRRIIVDANDNIYVAGVYPDATALDPQLLGDVPVSVGATDDGWVGFLLKLDTSLSKVWVHTWGLGVEHDVTGLAVDGDGNVFVAGHFRGTADFDWGAPTDTITSTSGRDAYVMKVAGDGVGTYQWTKRLTPVGGGTVRIRALAADADADVAVAGGFVGDVDFDPSGSVDARHSVDPATDDLFVVKLGATGNKKWIYTAGGSYHDRATSLTIDAQNAVFVGGEVGYGDAPNSGGAIDFDPEAAVDARATRSDGDALALKLGADGSYKWAKTVGAASVAAHTCDDRIDALSFDVTDGEDVRAFGRFGCSTDFDFSTVGLDYRVNAGSSDVFVLKL